MLGLTQYAELRQGDISHSSIKEGVGRKGKAGQIWPFFLRDNVFSLCADSGCVAQVLSIGNFNGNHIVAPVEQVHNTTAVKSSRLSAPLKF